MLFARPAVGPLSVVVCVLCVWGRFGFSSGWVRGGWGAPKHDSRIGSAIGSVGRKFATQVVQRD